MIDTRYEIQDTKEPLPIPKGIDEIIRILSVIVRKSLRVFLFSSYLASRISSFAHAAGEGTVDAEFLLFGAGARAASLAGTQAAMSDDVFAAYWSPAALGLLKTPEIAATYNQWVEDVSHQYAVGAFPTRKMGTFAFSLNRVAVEEFYGSDAQGTITGELETGAQAASVAWGLNLFRRTAAPGAGLFVGFSATQFKETIADVDSTGRAYDASLLWRPSGHADSPSWLRRTAVGAAIRRLGSAASFDGPTADLPMETVLGAAYSHFLSGDIVNLGLDYHQSSAESSYLSGGAEYWLNSFLAVRAGLRTGQKGAAGAGWRAGMGFRLKPVQVDYAWSPMGEDLGAGHQVSLTWRFGPVEAALSPGIADDLYTHHMAQGQAHMTLEMYDRAVLEFNDALRIRPKDDKAIKLLMECGEKMKQ